METVNSKDVISVKESRPMKVAHFAIFSPNQAGIAGTALDMILAERATGIDSQFIDYAGDKPCRVGLTHGNITTVGPSWAEKADILVRHSAIPPSLKNIDKPIVMCMHGRLEYTFLLEYYKKSAVLQEYYDCVKDPRYMAFITFWPEHLETLKILLPGKQIDLVPAMVDLKMYNPDGISYNYGKIGGKPNILIADMFREDVTPFNVLMAASIFVKKYCPEARVHIYGLQRQKEAPVKPLIDKLREQGIIGEAETLVRNMDRVYRSSDILVTPHVIATRLIREACASGLPIVAGTGCPYTPYTANPADPDNFAREILRCWSDVSKNKEKVSKESRQMAELNFDPVKSGQEARKVYERVLESKPIQLRNVPMIYNFIPYATESEEKNLGKAYNRYMELLPKDDDWACFIDHDAMFTTDDWFKQLGRIIAHNPEYGCLSVVTNRIGNPEQKIANLKDTHDMLYHRSIGRLAQSQKYFDVMDVTKTHCISGVVILVKKSVWKKAGGFKEGFLGIDNDFHIRVMKAGYKIGVMRGVYCYHCYRADNQSGLAPVVVTGEKTKPKLVEV